MKYPNFPYDELLKTFDRKIYQRAKSIVHSGGVLIDEEFSKESFIGAEVRSQSRDVYYNVEIANYKDNDGIEIFCDCPYGEGCKHAAAVLIFMKKQNEKQSPAPLTDTAKPNLQLTVVPPKINLTKPSRSAETTSIKKQDDTKEPFRAPIPEITLDWFVQYSDPKNIKKAQDILWSLYNTRFQENSKTASSFSIKKSGKETIETLYQIVNDEILEIRCSCGQTGNTFVCEHAHAGLLYIRKYYGSNYFLFRAKTDELKTQLLQEYGYTIRDYPKNVFTFSIERNKLILQCSDPSYRKLTDLISGETGLMNPEQGLDNFSTRKKRNGKTEQPDEEEIAVIINCNDEHFPHFHFSLIRGRYSDETKIFEGKPVYYNLMDPSVRNLNFPDKELLELLALAQSAHLHYLAGHYMPNRDPNDFDPEKKISKKRLAEISPVIFRTLLDLMPKLKKYPRVYYPMYDPKNYRSKYLPCIIHETPLPFKIFYRAGAEHGEIVAGYPNPVKKDTAIVRKDKMFFLCQFESDIYCLSPYEESELISRFDENPVIRFPLTATKQILLNFLFPLKEKYDVDLPDNIHIEPFQQEPQPEIFLSEHKNKYLLIRPVIRYGTIYVTRLMKGNRIVFENKDRYYSTERQTEKEKVFFDLIESLHPDFPDQNQDAYFLSFSNALADNWFFNAYHRLTENNIGVFGQNNLKHFKYNTNKPSLNFNCSSGVDWFDLKVELRYGDQTVSFRDFRKALIKKQQFVVLDDGTLGSGDSTKSGFRNIPRCSGSARLKKTI